MRSFSKLLIWIAFTATTLVLLSACAILDLRYQKAKYRSELYRVITTTVAAMDWGNLPLQLDVSADICPLVSRNSAELMATEVEDKRVVSYAGAFERTNLERWDISMLEGWRDQALRLAFTLDTKKCTALVITY
ncbi:MAG: hypothetical protein ABL962_04270 [Fimbriimonadaceae bacterium]